MAFIAKFFSKFKKKPDVVEEQETQLEENITTSQVQEEEEKV